MFCRQKLLGMIGTRPGLCLGALSLAAMTSCCVDSNHGATIEAHAGSSLSRACVTESLASFHATIAQPWTNEEKAVYLISSEEGTASVVFLHPKGTGNSTFEISWMEPEQRTKSQAVAMHQLISKIYNRTSERCGGLPPFNEATAKCWRSGCLP